MKTMWRRRTGTAANGARPRSFLRKAGDVVLAVAILGMLILVVARLDRVETRRTEGAAVVNDGDSLTIGDTRVRLRGIDAPEYGQICHRDGGDYRCGQSSRAALLALIGNGTVVCDGWERDRYGRLLGNCRAGATELNRAQVEAGWAVAFGDFEEEERVARDARLGLWSGTFDMPRDWRATHGGLAEAGHGWPAAILNWLREILRFF